MYEENPFVINLYKYLTSTAYRWMYTEIWGVLSRFSHHYSEVIMRAMASQITGVSIVCSAVCSGPDQRKHQSSASLAFVKGIHRWPVDSPHKGPVTRKMFPFDDVIMMLPVRSGFVWYNYVIFYICTEQYQTGDCRWFVDKPLSAEADTVTLISYHKRRNIWLGHMSWWR